MTLSSVLASEPLEAEDLYELKQWMNSEDVYKNLYILFHPMSMSDLSRWYNREKADSAHIFKYLNQKEMIGIGMLHYIHQKNRCGELSIIISPDHFDKGYGRKILRQLMDYSFRIMNLHKIFLHTTEFNKRMLALIEELKFTGEGVFRKELYYSESYHDILRFGMLRDEYVRNEQ